MSRVLLLTMPFGPISRPAIGISLLKAQLKRRNIECDLRYASVDFARLIGIDSYIELSEKLPTASLIGDWIFRKDLFGADLEGEGRYKDFILKRFGTSICSEQFDLYREYQDYAVLFLDWCMTEFNFDKYDIVGFTTTFQQTVASIALARRIKQQFPRIKTMIGGANCEGEMGIEIHRQFSFLDFVFSGESDTSFPVLVEALLFGADRALPQLDGVFCRQHADPPKRLAGTVIELDQLPFPDYDDFHTAMSLDNLGEEIGVQYLIETSRGCWWGQKHHCTFCGLNGSNIHYRSKSPSRVVEEIVHLKNGYNARTIFATDNILDTHYFKTTLPMLKSLDLGLSIFFETKSNLTKDQLILMKETGLEWFQPGIESLNTHQLNLMKKGSTALMNIQTLKWARQLRMPITWNILMGFPGETERDYELMAEYCEKVIHLQPPSGAHPVRLDRFSPLFDRSDEFGIDNVRAYAAYQYVYPFPEEALKRIAYFFDFDYRDGYDPLRAGKKMLDVVARWCAPGTPPMLLGICGDNLLLINDTRPIAAKKQIFLVGLESKIYLYCDRIRSFDQIVQHCRDVCEGTSVREIVEDCLKRFVEDNIVLEEDGKYLGLAILVDQNYDGGPVADQRLRNRASRGASNSARIADLAIAEGSA